MKRNISLTPLGDLYVTAQIKAVDEVDESKSAQLSEIVREIDIAMCIVRKGQRYQLWVNEDGHLNLEII